MKQINKKHNEKAQRGKGPRATWRETVHLREKERASTSSIEYCVHFLGYHKILTTTLVAYNHRNLFSRGTGRPKSKSRFGTEPIFDLPESYSIFPLAIYFTYDNVGVSMLLSPFVPPSPSPAVSKSPFSTSASLSLYRCPANG